MKLPAALKHLLFPHKAWPYPRGPRQVRQVIVVTGIILFLALAGIIIGVMYEQQKSLGKQDVQFAAQDLTSYGNQMLLIARSSLNKPLVQPYRQVYLQQLDTDVSQVHKKLAEHSSKASVQKQSDKLLAISDQLSRLLAGFAKDSSDATLTRSIPKLQTLLDQTSRVEDTL